jgi:dienelactone hydrolase
MKELKGDITVYEETIDDAIFATEILKKDNRIDKDKVFILGHSMGGMLAPRIDAQGGDYAGIIIWAGSPRRLEEIMRDQQKDYLKSAKGIIRWWAKKQFDKLDKKFDNIYNLTDDEAKKTPLFGKHMFVYYLKEWGEKPSSMYLDKSDKPIIVMQGEDDVHVSIEKDFNGYKEILADNPKVEFELYPGLNHCFMKSIYNDVSKVMKEYKVEQHVEDYVINDIVRWVFSFER